MKIGLALSGGGVKSSAQLGVIQALHDGGIHPEVFAGTSGGSIVATLMALGCTPSESLQLIKKNSDMLDIAIAHIIKGMISKKDTVQGLFKGKRLEKSLDNIFKGCNFGDVDLPLGIVTTDINNGRQIIFSNRYDIDESKVNDTDFLWFVSNYEDKLSEVVRASCGLPGLFIPKELKLLTLVDGGLINNLPSDIASALGADRVISIDLGKAANSYRTGNAYSILLQSYSIIYDRSEDNNRNYYDIHLNPKVNDLSVLDSSQLEEGFYRGYEYGKKHINSIIDALDKNYKLSL